MPSATVPGLGTLSGSPGNYVCTLFTNAVSNQAATDTTSAAVVGASTTAPIVLTLATPLTLKPGFSRIAIIVGVGGLVAANGSWPFSLSNLAMTLIGSDGTSSPAYTSGGSVSVSGSSDASNEATRRGIVTLSPITVSTPDLSCVLTAMALRWSALNPGVPLVPNVATNTVREWAGQLVNAFRAAGGVVPT